ncbi:DUF4249 domain-containing protein [Hymenobacter sp. 15J16-1T3B]|uniref:DUF4249 domain-containing protein n=1 Tax=Hymenobacter sp. 15J16-1T3B TaxID=2886941 RepID=UPI001D117BF2|nr:DUF4249 domain-containing protein [Hymenobacter sp. 15J16-1T3B]MCC3159118.1 DUF4249 domain-containing protein [Hymenobacter sp. 15J16-1T3B]
MKSVTIRLMAGGLVLLAGCVEPYEPKVAASDTNLLVVDGYINPTGVTSIRLSRTAALSSTTLPAEKRARVFIEEEEGTRYPLTETTTAGTYASAALQLPAGRRVRLRLTTAANRDYASDFTPVQRTPDIDSVSWRVANDELRVFVNTHNTDDAARHYRWSYDETWEFTSRYPSLLTIRNGQFVTRTDNIYRCWGREAPSTILLGTTTRLSRNVVAEQVVTKLRPGSTKLVRTYSVLVRQYAVSQDEYEYWEKLRTNTESLGTLFDPLPSQLTGNVHSLTDPAEQVLGYVGAQSVTEKRLFIDRTQLPSAWPLVSGYEACILKIIPEGGNLMPPLNVLVESFRDGKNIPLEFDPGTGQLYFATAECVDCRLRGTNVKPSFWP